jgi:polyribonucleotide nucleotidyltransferase
LLQAKEARLEILDVMRHAISEPRSEVNGTAPKIISFEIPIDKVGEVIGPKGKVINTMQQETGADISVDDVDGKYGVVTIGSKDSAAVNEARARIELIINPPKAEIGATYNGKVVSITKFGAFINILPGRDGLVHISKMGGGKRINQVEDVLNLGDELEVRVEDVDPQGKVSLVPVNALVAGESGDAGEGAGSGGSTAGRATMSFEDEFSAELSAEIGDLGPAQAAPRDREGGNRGGNRGGGRFRGNRR